MFRGTLANCMCNFSRHLLYCPTIKHGRPFYREEPYQSVHCYGVERKVVRRESQNFHGSPIDRSKDPKLSESIFSDVLLRQKMPPMRACMRQIQACKLNSSMKTKKPSMVMGIVQTKKIQIFGCVFHCRVWVFSFSSSVKKFIPKNPYKYFQHVSWSNLRYKGLTEMKVPGRNRSVKADTVSDKTLPSFRVCLRMPFEMLLLATVTKLEAY